MKEIKQNARLERLRRKLAVLARLSRRHKSDVDGQLHRHAPGRRQAGAGCGRPIAGVRHGEDGAPLRTGGQARSFRDAQPSPPAQGAFFAKSGACAR